MADTDVDGSNPPSGWYPDPEDTEFLRRWDGQVWTEDRIPASRARRRVREREGRDPDVAPIDEGIDDLVQDSRAELVRLEQATTRELERRADELARLKEETRSELERRQTLLADLKIQENEARRSVREALAAAEDEAHSLVQTARDEVAGLSAARAEAARGVEEHRATLAELVDEEEETRGRVETVRIELEGLTTSAQAAVREAEERRAELAQLSTARDATAQEAEEHRTALAEVTAAEEQACVRLDAQEAESTRLAEVAAAAVAEAERRQAELAGLEEQAASLRAAILDLRDRLSVQDLGLYEYRHPAEDSAALSTRLTHVRQAIVQVLRDGEAVALPASGKRGRSAAKGGQLADEMAQLALRAYNAEAESCVRTAGTGGIDGALTRLIRAREAVARHGESLGLAITDRYHQLRAEEIEIAGDYRVRKQREDLAARNRPATEPAPPPPGQAEAAAGWAGSQPATPSAPWTPSDEEAQSAGTWGTWPSSYQPSAVSSPVPPGTSG